MNTKLTGIFLAFLLFGCYESNQSNLNHPTIENISKEKGASFNNVEINFQDLNSDEEWKGLENFNLLFSLGEGESNPIGQITNVVIDRYDRFIFLDERTQEILVVEKSGETIKKLGGRGQGPGELNYAKSLEIVNDSLLFVGNQFRIEIFDLNQEEVEFNRTFQSKINIRDLCSMGGKLYIHNVGLLNIENDNSELETTNMIQVLDLPDLEFIESFGKTYKSDSPMVIDRLSQGHVNCLEKAETLIFTFDRFPLVHGYDIKTNKLKWKSHIENLSSMIIKEEKAEMDSKLTYSIRENKTIDSFLKPIELTQEELFIQVDRRIIGGLDNVPSSINGVLNAASGKMKFENTINEKILLYNDEFLITASMDYDRISVYSKEEN